jgi:hypothetical protein
MGGAGTTALSPYAASLVVKKRIAAVCPHLRRPQPALGFLTCAEEAGRRCSS